MNLQSVSYLQMQSTSAYGKFYCVGVVEHAGDYYVVTNYGAETYGGHTDWMTKRGQYGVEVYPVQHTASIEAQRTVRAKANKGYVQTTLPSLLSVPREWENRILSVAQNASPAVGAPRPGGAAPTTAPVVNEPATAPLKLTSSQALAAKGLSFLQEGDLAAALKARDQLIVNRNVVRHSLDDVEESLKILQHSLRQSLA